MKQFAFSTTVILIVFAAYSYGQANQKPPAKNCCCEHTQQIAEDLHWIREQLSKPFVGGEHVTPNDPGDIEMPDFTPPKINKPNFNNTPIKKPTIKH